MLSSVLACFEFAFWGHRPQEKEEGRIKEGEEERIVYFQAHERTVKILNGLNSSGHTCPSLCLCNWVQKSNCRAERAKESFCPKDVRLKGLPSLVVSSLPWNLELRDFGNCKVMSFIGWAFCTFYWHWCLSLVPSEDGVWTRICSAHPQPI